MPTLSDDQIRTFGSFQKILLKASGRFDDEAEVGKRLSEISTSDDHHETREVILRLCKEVDPQAEFPSTLVILNQYYLFFGKSIDDLRVELKSLRQATARELQEKTRKPSEMTSLAKIFLSGDSSDKLSQKEYDDAVRSLAEIEGRALLCRDHDLYFATRDLRLAVVEIVKSRNSGFSSMVMTERNSVDTGEGDLDQSEDGRSADGGYLYQLENDGYINTSLTSSTSSLPRKDSAKRKSHSYPASAALNENPDQKEFTYEDLISFITKQSDFIDPAIKRTFTDSLKIDSCAHLLQVVKGGNIATLEIDLTTLRNSYEVFTKLHSEHLDGCRKATTLAEKSKMLRICLDDVTSLIMFDLLLFHLEPENQEKHLANAKENIEIFEEHLTGISEVEGEKHDLFTYVEGEPVVVAQVTALFESDKPEITNIQDLFAKAEKDWAFFKKRSLAILVEHEAALDEALGASSKEKNPEEKIKFLKKVLSHKAAMIVATGLLHYFEDDKGYLLEKQAKHFEAIKNGIKSETDKADALAQSILDKLLTENIEEVSKEVFEEASAESLERCRESKEKFLAGLGDLGIVGLLKELHPQEKKTGVLATFSRAKRHKKHDESTQEKADEIAAIFKEFDEILTSTPPLAREKITPLEKGEQRITAILFGDAQTIKGNDHLTNLIAFCDDLSSLVEAHKRLQHQVEKHNPKRETALQHPDHRQLVEPTQLGHKRP